MIDILSDKYKIYSLNINNKLKKGQTWDQIRSLKTSNENDLEDALENLADNLDAEKLTISEWYEIVDHVKHDKDSEVDIQILEPVMIPAASDEDYKLDYSQGSSWSSYKRVLYKKNFDSDTVDIIEQSSHKILNKLSLNTTARDAIKGLVIGNVQSGKTANMAALMAMAADTGWNLFIVLSGTIENLRIQTQERLINDLKSATNVAWTSIDNVSTSSSFHNALSKLSLGDDSKQRYLMVCLKNSTRLNNLLTWMNKDQKNREKLKILIIDDEADQAGINSTRKTVKAKDDQDDIERTAINKAIVNLLTNKDKKSKLCTKKPLAINYVAYTATPYANVLNEKPGPNSTYPADFVASLGVSNKYFGPQQIFGLESENIDGLNIINLVPQEELDEVKEIQKGLNSTIPKELEQAILWFYCCLAIRRYYNDCNPVSMLIHTSQKQPDHDKIAEIIRTWIGKFTAFDFIQKCQKVYDKQTSNFTLDSFKKGYSKYDSKGIRNYPSFSDIANILSEIFNTGLKSILINDEGEPQFNKGVHLCIDNCSHYLGENGDEHIRLLYPKKKMSFATGFIVVGGATLSRGLTIEGLVSTYFLRTVRQADSLMQMGRWFGYRIGYELLPRIWISQDTKEKFEFLSVMDYELRQKMKYMEDNGIKPQTVGISIMEYANKKLEITSRNKSKDAAIVDMDFAGLATQTTIFYDDKSKLESNYKNTIEFIDLLPTPSSFENHIKTDGCILWENIKNETVLNYIKKLSFPKVDSKFLDVKLFEKWYEDLASTNKLINWNVAISGIKGDKLEVYSKYEICKTNRSKKSDDSDGLIRIGALRNPRDLYLDVDITKLGKEDKKYVEKSSASNFLEIRKNAGLDKTSLLVIYFINKDSQPKSKDSGRVPLNAPIDIIGITIVLPKQSNGTSSSTHKGIVIEFDGDSEDE